MGSPKDSRGQQPCSFLKKFLWFLISCLAVAGPCFVGWLALWTTQRFQMMDDRIMMLEERCALTEEKLKQYIIDNKDRIIEKVRTHEKTGWCIRLLPNIPWFYVHYPLGSEMVPVSIRFRAMVTVFIRFMRKETIHIYVGNAGRNSGGPWHPGSWGRVFRQDRLPQTFELKKLRDVIIGSEKQFG